jgi:glutamyl-tRNA reductase
MPKSTSVQKEMLIEQCVTLLIEGYRRKDIVQYFTENHDKCERTVDNYLSEAYEKISTDKDLQKKIIKQSLKRFNDLYDKNSAIQDYKECRQVQESILKLFGLNQPDKIDHTNNGQSFQPFIFYAKPSE